MTVEPITWLVEAAIVVPGYWHPSEDERREFFEAMLDVESPGVEAEVGWTTDDTAFIRMGAVADKREEAADAVLEIVRQAATERALLAPAEVIRVAILAVRPLDELKV
jgi:hypothetical protein